MYTLKIKWMRFEPDTEYAREHPSASPQSRLADETTLFVLADVVEVGSEVKSLDEMKAWEAGDYLDYSMPFGNDDSDQKLVKGTRLIHVIRSNNDVWYLASNAWLLGPDGKTIERLA